MMYEELVKRLRAWRKAGLSNSHVFKEAADAIEELSAEVLSDRAILKRYGGETGIKNLQEYADKYWDLLKKAPRWIPVTEDLPVIDPEHHVSRDVIVRVDGGVYMFSALEENIFGQVWFECERMSPSGDDGYTVTHWMSLPSAPEPPKEET